MDIQNKFTQIFKEDNSNLSVVSFGENITFKISKLLEVAYSIFCNKALALIDEE